MDFRNLIFLHIPKAAGTTLQNILRRQYPADQYYTVSTSPSVRASIASLRNLPEAKRRRIRCVMGHGAFGLHDALVGPTRYITLLRDPIERVISNYYYVRRASAHRLHDTLHAQEWSLREYIEQSENPQLSNGMTRSIAGGEADDVTESTYKQALSHLSEHFAVAGTAERFDGSFLLMKHELGWSNVYYRRRNATNKRPGREEIPDSTRCVIREKNRYDLKLYRHVQSNLEKQLAPLDLSMEKRKLHVQCALYKGYQNVRSRARKLLAPLRLI